MSDLKEDIAYTIDDIQLLVDKSEPLRTLCEAQEPDYYYCAAIGSMLHSFYNGIEKVFFLVNKNIDKTELTGERTHKNLLERMAQDTDARNKVISAETRDSLKDYMAFRHFFRHSYDFQLKWELLKPLFFKMEPTWKTAKKDFESFLETL